MLRQISKFFQNGGLGSGTLKNFFMKQLAQKQTSLIQMRSFSEKMDSKLENVAFWDLEKQINPNIKIDSENNTISTVIDGKTVQYQLNDEIKGATLGDKDRYIMMFTCGHCGHKDTKTFTKKAYHSSVVIIRCDGCDNNHLVADNLGWFRDEKVNIEQISKEHGNNMTKVNSSPRLQQVLNKIKFVGVKGEVHGVSTSEKDDVIKNIGGAEETKKNQ